MTSPATRPLQPPMQLLPDDGLPGAAALGAGAGSFPRRRGEEDALHRAVARILNLALSPHAYWFHPANGEQRTARAGARLKGMGVRPGVPDICIVYGGQAYFIELKSEKGRVQPDQKACHEALRNAGASVSICRSLEDVADALQRWGVPLDASTTGRPA